MMSQQNKTKLDTLIFNQFVKKRKTHSTKSFNAQLNHEHLKELVENDFRLKQIQRI